MHQTATGAAPRTTSSPAATRAVDAPTIAHAFRITSATRSRQVAVRTKDGEVSLTWGRLRERVDAVAAGLSELGVRRGDAVALLLSNRPEFHVVDLAAMMLGATSFSIYETYAPNQIEFVIADADARVAIVERRHLARLLEARTSLPALEHVILIDPDGEELPEGVLTLEAVEGSGASLDVEQAVSRIEPDDVLTLIYTSGTTGPPKGVQLTHRNLLAAVAGIEELVPFPDGARVISWLPAAHVAERAAHHYLPIVFGFTITTCANPREVLSYVAAVRPNWFFAVPRVWEKLKAGLEAMVSGLPAEQREAHQQALSAALEKVRLEQAARPVPDELATRAAEADERVFAPLRRQLGFGEIGAVNVGAAPTPIEVLEFFHAIGIPVAELWGMSETCGAGCVNPPERIKIGTVGRPAPGVQVCVGEDGELLVRGAMIMRGYRNLPERTAEALDEQGWLHTGDIAKIDDDGYVTIVDRKKEIIINSAGKNMSPANIEAAIKSASPLIGQACVFGDARPYNTALIVLDADFAPPWARQHGVAGDTLDQIAGDSAIRAAVQAAVDAANTRLARVEQIKRFCIVPGDWLAGGDELTPTMKLKRRPIGEKYEAEIAALYETAANGGRPGARTPNS